MNKAKKQELYERLREIEKTNALLSDALMVVSLELRTLKEENAAGKKPLPKRRNSKC